MTNQVPFNALTSSRMSTLNDNGTMSQDMSIDNLNSSQNYSTSLEGMHSSASNHRINMQQAASLEQISSRELLHPSDQRRSVPSMPNVSNIGHRLIHNGNIYSDIHADQFRNHYNESSMQRTMNHHNKRNQRGSVDMSLYPDGPMQQHHRDQYSGPSPQPRHPMENSNNLNLQNANQDNMISINERVLQDILLRNHDPRSAAMHHRERHIFGDYFRQTQRNHQFKLHSMNQRGSGELYDAQSSGPNMNPAGMINDHMTGQRLGAKGMYNMSGNMSPSYAQDANSHSLQGGGVAPIPVYQQQHQQHEFTSLYPPSDMFNNSYYNQNNNDRFESNYTSAPRRFQDFDYQQNYHPNRSGISGGMSSLPQSVNARQTRPQSKNNRVLAFPASKYDSPSMTVTNRGYYVKFLFNKCVVADIQNSIKKLYQFLKRHSFGFSIGDQYKNIGDRWCVLTHPDKNVLITGIFLMVHYCRRKFLKKRGIVDKKIICEVRGDRKLQHSYTRTTFKFLCDTEVDKDQKLRNSLTELIDGLNSCEQVQEGEQRASVPGGIEGSKCSDYNVVPPSIDNFDGMFTAVRTYRNALDREPGHIDNIIKNKGVIEDLCLRCFIGEEPTPDVSEYLCGIVCAVKAKPETAMSVVEKICNLIITANYEANIYEKGGEIPTYRRPSVTSEEPRMVDTLASASGISPQIATDYDNASVAASSSPTEPFVIPSSANKNEESSLIYSLSSKSEMPTLDTSIMKESEFPRSENKTNDDSEPSTTSLNRVVVEVQEREIMQEVTVMASQPVVGVLSIDEIHQ